MTNDQIDCVGQNVTDQEIKELCRSMKEVALINAVSNEQKAAVRDVTVQQLLSWGILVEGDGSIYPTNAYEILTGRNGAMIQCGVFKGKTKAVFVDRREYDGPIWDQIEEAYQFVLRNIHLGALFSGIYRQDVYEIPPVAIRELIINAAVHRSYIDHENIQVAVYDDRLEVLSPGKFAMGQTMEKMLQGRSVIRNEALANAFAYMNLIEHWGSGIPRIVHEVEEMGLPDPVFEDGDTYICADIYRKNEGDPDDLKTDPDDLKDGTENFESDTVKNRDNIKESLTDFEIKLLNIIDAHPKMTQTELGYELGVSPSTIKRELRKLQNNRVVRREGSNRDGKWIVL